MQQLLQLYKDSFGGLSREVWLLSAVMFINRAGTMVITFLMIYLTLQLDFSLARAGIVMSCFGLGSVMGSYIGGWLTDRIGYFRVMFWSLFLGGASFFLLIPLESFWGWCLGVTFVSTVADSFRPAGMAAIGIYSKPENRTRSLSLLRVAVNIGISIGPAVGGWVALHLGYKYLFMLDGLTCMFAAVAFYFLLPRREAKSVEETLNTNTADIGSASAYKDVFFLKFLFFVFLNMLVFMHLLNVLMTFWKTQIGLTEQQIGLLLTFNGLVIGLFEMPAVYLLERKYRTFPLIIIGGFLIGMAYWIYPVLGFGMGVVLVSIVAITVGEVINFPFINAVALNRAPSDRRGQYMGLYGMTFSVALILAPALGGKIVELWSYNTLWWILGGVSCISLLGFQSLSKTYETERQAELKKQLDLV